MLQKRILLPLISLVMGLLLVGCEGIPVPPVDTAENMAKLIEKDMTLTQVYDLMDVELRDNTTLYPAQSIEQTTDGNWIFTSKEGGFVEDEEAVFYVLAFSPNPAGTDYYMVFFENDLVIENAWFISTHAATIIQILEGTLIAN